MENIYLENWEQIEGNTNQIYEVIWYKVHFKIGKKLEGIKIYNIIFPILRSGEIMKKIDEDGNVSILCDVYTHIRGIEINLHFYNKKKWFKYNNNICCVRPLKGITAEFEKIFG